MKPRLKHLPHAIEVIVRHFGTSKKVLRQNSDDSLAHGTRRTRALRRRYRRSHDKAHSRRFRVKTIQLKRVCDNPRKRLFIFGDFIGLIRLLRIELAMRLNTAYRLIFIQRDTRPKTRRRNCQTRSPRDDIMLATEDKLRYCRECRYHDTSKWLKVRKRGIFRPPLHSWRGGGRLAEGEVSTLAKIITSAVGRCLSPSPNLSHLP